MSEYGLMVLVTVGVTVALIGAAAIVRGVVWAVVTMLWRGGRSVGVAPNSASKRTKLR